MKIGILGAFSTGKTTLLNELKKIDYFKDFYFDISLERKIAKDLGINFNKSTEEEILKYQEKLFNETLKVAKYKNKVITDTPAHLGLIYTNNNKLKSKMSNVLKKEKLYDVLVYLPIEFSIINDGIRHNDVAFQKQIDKGIKEILKQKELIHNAKVITLTWTVEKRLFTLLNKLNIK